MKTILYYFTGTGNSLAVARVIADRLPDTELIPMLLLDGEKIRAQKDANIGIISPLYAMGLPGIVVRSSTSSTSQTPTTSFPSSPKVEPTAPPPVR